VNKLVLSWASELCPWKHWESTCKPYSLIFQREAWN